MSLPFFIPLQPSSPLIRYSPLPHHLRKVCPKGSFHSPPSLPLNLVYRSILSFPFHLSCEPSALPQHPYPGSLKETLKKPPVIPDRRLSFALFSHRLNLLPLPFSTTFNQRITGYWTGAWMNTIISSPFHTFPKYPNPAQSMLRAPVHSITSLTGCLRTVPARTASKLFYPYFQPISPSL